MTAITTTSAARHAAEETPMKNTALVLLATLALITTIACGDGGGKLPSPTSPSSSSPATNPNPTPAPAPPQGPFNQTLTGTVPAFDEAFQQFVAPRDGMATLKLTWADASADLDLVVTDGSCTSLYGADAANCQQFGVSGRIVGTEETISTALTAGQAYRLWVDNFAHSAQAYTIEIEIP
jgi:hypothetical protein